MKMNKEEEGVSKQTYTKLAQTNQKNFKKIQKNLKKPRKKSQMRDLHPYHTPCPYTKMIENPPIFTDQPPRTPNNPKKTLTELKKLS